MEIIGYNEDLVTLILLYLPVKSILRFKSVTKQWRNLLSSSTFIQRHASRQTMSNTVLFFSPFPCIKSLNLNGNNHRLDTVDFGFLRSSCRDITSCNGLLLVHSSKFGVEEEEEEEEEPQRRSSFHVYNPFTRKHSELAVPDYIATLEQRIYFNLAFNPSKSPHYKVVFYWSDNCNYIHIAIYSSETRTCRRSRYSFDTFDAMLFPGVYLNGAIHWINDMKMSEFYDEKMTSFYFDTNQELIKVYPMPPRDVYGNGCMYYGKCQGHLNVILSDEDDHIQSFLDVYELKEDYSSWFLKYKIDLDVIAVGFPEIIITLHTSEEYYNYSFLYLLEGDEEEPVLVLSVGHNQLLAYNLKDKTTKKLCDDVECTDEGGNILGYGYIRCIWWFQAVHCVENLFGV